MSENKLVELLHTSRINNKRNRITGMLLFKNGYFMQVIEGDEVRVNALMNTIKSDIRHKNIDILREEYIQSREFPDWTMGFQNLDSKDCLNIQGFTKILENNFKPEYFAEHTTEAHALLLAFKRNSKVNNSFKIGCDNENNTNQSHD